MSYIALLFIGFLFINLSCQPEPDDNSVLELTAARAGTLTLKADETTEGVAVSAACRFSFSAPLDTSSVNGQIVLTDAHDKAVAVGVSYRNDQKTLVVKPKAHLAYGTNHTISLGNAIASKKGAAFQGAGFQFVTQSGTMELLDVAVSGMDLMQNQRVKGVGLQPTIRVVFSHSLNKEELAGAVQLANRSSEVALAVEAEKEDSVFLVQTQTQLADYTPYTFRISSALTSSEGFSFGGFEKTFYTQLDSTDKFERISDEALLTKVQEQTFKYFWDYAHPTSGLTRERLGSGNTVTTGGSGFGIMTIPVAIERGFITRQQGLERLEKILDFLAQADRFHGAWPHWMNGETGEVIPFSEKDNGGDLVETAFMVQGLLTVRAYLNPGNAQENALIAQIDTLWHGVEWDWYTQGENVLYWHWSPEYDFAKDMPIRGHNETQIVYVLAAASPHHGISASVYHKGYARSGAIQNNSNFYGYELLLGSGKGGPLFFTHYSYLGLDPRNLQDAYANYWKQNQNHTLINRAYCIANPKNYVGYGPDSWGLTASDSHDGYSAHAPMNDLGVITPTAAISSMPYTPEKSMEALRFFYYKLGDRLWGPYGFYDAYSPTHQWWANSYLAIDQGPVVLMIENHRSGLLWNLFMQAPEVQTALEDLGFTYQ